MNDAFVKSSFDSSRPGFSRIGERIGRYRITGILSEGGMGIVYEARQEQPERTVALKVIKHGFPSASTRRRFEHEAEALARLRHPNIAQVIEAGSFRDRPDGPELPFFALEYVPEARSLCEYARREELSLRTRLTLFLQVCSAVQHGHQRGIIHRDLKPENILVDEDGAVKVIDFGVARITDSDVEATTAVTEAGQLIGTLQYMSPEQLDADPAELDTRSDVYALGVVLYELLCDALPYDVTRAALLEASRLIAEEPPKRPSTVNRRLRGDVETIVLKALEKQREHRYQTVRELGEDIRRYLGGEVILARRAGPWLRLRKGMRRRPVASLSIVAALSCGIGFLAYVAFYSNPRLAARTREVERETAALMHLSAKQTYEDLIRQARELWPPHPESAEEYRDWIRDARGLVDQVPGWIKKREELRATAVDGKTGTRWWIDQLTTLIEEVGRLERDERGPLREDVIHTDLGWSIPKRLRAAERLQEDFGNDGTLLRRWRAAAPALRESYPNLEVGVQMALVPVGADPDSGLWEFWHVLSGDEPARDTNGKLVVTGSTGLVFVLLPGGKFWMGSQRSDPEGPDYDPQSLDDESPAHEVKLSPFFLSKYELTQGQWERLAGWNPAYYGGRSGTPEVHPVEQVSWFDCMKYLPRFELTLPSEAQWEYGARGGTGTPRWTGVELESLFEKRAANLADRTFAGESSVSWPEEAWPEFDDGYVTHAPVGSFAANPFGLHDVMGNVEEWCLDRYTNGYYLWGPREDPVFTLGRSGIRIIRGGGFDSVSGSTDRIGSATRSVQAEGNGTMRTGVRPVRALLPPPPATR